MRRPLRPFRWWQLPYRSPSCVLPRVAGLPSGLPRAERRVADSVAEADPAPYGTHAGGGAGHGLQSATGHTRGVVELGGMRRDFTP